MKRILYNFAWIIGLLTFVAGCDLFEQEEFSLGAPPTEQDAVFTYAPTAENDNIIRFTSPSSGFMKTWDFGNGAPLAKGDIATGVYPLKGTYEVTLTVFTSGGSVSSTQTIEIAETDPTLLDLPVYNMLTGGPNGPGQKTWVIDAARAGHFGVGPVDASSPIWYAAGPNEKQGGGLYNDTYTFQLEGFTYLMETAGDVYLNGGQAGNFPGSYESPVGDYTAPYTPPANLSWSVSENDQGVQFITISNGGFIGYYTGVRTYEIISLSDNELVLKYFDAANDALAWFLRLIPEGYTPPPPPPPAGVSLPLGFETQSPTFTTFGGSTYELVDNPDKSGINTSNKVAKTEHGGETWAGLFFELTDPLDFSTQPIIKLKVWAPQAGTFRFKLENMDNPQGDFIEIDAEVPVAEEWVELSFDLSQAASGRYARMVLFPGWNVSNAGTFYFDDIRQAAPPLALPITFETQEPAFTTFGGSTYEVVDNPDKSGINTSNRVAKTVHGGETWAGLFVELGSPLDFSGQGQMKVKVWAPQTGTFRFKLENMDDPQGDFIELDAEVTVAEQWTEVSFDFSSAPAGRYARLVVFPGWSVANAGTFYFDDIRLE
ncbi:PKD domain-containing protein [Cesiribacter andamanensis]|uniref:Carbohydrate binding domain protein n=1 Tax=Cesiribacter andamanensis AMV16 TaxID=1279009 RepID=M7MW69_9BACT|nr:PKD domain-containing protein [Cesiribacter andamanensis]EMR00683.1 Carbohydrate binding domain protein [Cesiribacter andamanensis AMV16]